METRIEYNQRRQRIISTNRSRRMRGKPCEPVPPTLPTVYGWQILDLSGDYVDFTLSPAKMKEYRAQGFTINKEPAIITGHLPAQDITQPSPVPR